MGSKGAHRKGALTFKHFYLLLVSDLDLETVAPRQPAAHADAPALQGWEIQALANKQARRLGVQGDGEVSAPVGAEVEKDTAPHISRLEDDALLD